MRPRSENDFLTREANKLLGLRPHASPDVPLETGAIHNGIFFVPLSDAIDVDTGLYTYPQIEHSHPPLTRRAQGTFVDDFSDDTAVRVDVQTAIKKIKPRNADIIADLYGINLSGHEPLPDRTLEKVGQKHGVTHELIRQQRNKALGRLAIYLKSYRPPTANTQTSSIPNEQIKAGDPNPAMNVEPNQVPPGLPEIRPEDSRKWPDLLRRILNWRHRT